MDISKIQINDVNYNLKDASAVVSGTYDSSSQKIVFKNKDNVVICQIDATPFIVDGMVSNVAVSNGNLVITFNTDAGKSPISIPLTDIFNPSEYYTKIGYFVCDTAANTAAKTINATGFVLSTGGSIKIKMTNDNTANNATLNINSTGAKPLYYAGLRASSTNTWEPGETIEVYYDGTNYMANNVAGSGGDGVFDISAKYPTSGEGGGNTYTLQGALTVLNSNLSANRKKGGMSIKYVQTSDNNSTKYVQYFLTKDAWSTNEADWEKINLEEEVSQISQKVDKNDFGVNGTYNAQHSTTIGSWVNYHLPIRLVSGHKYLITIARDTAPSSPVYLYLRDAAYGQGGSTLKTLTLDTSETSDSQEYTPSSDYENVYAAYYCGAALTGINLTIIDSASIVAEIGKKIDKSAIADNLLTNDPEKVLSAKQGYVLGQQVDSINKTVNGEEGFDETCSFNTTAGTGISNNTKYAMSLQAGKKYYIVLQGFENVSSIAVYFYDANGQVQDTFYNNADGVTPVSRSFSANVRAKYVVVQKDTTHIGFYSSAAQVIGTGAVVCEVSKDGEKSFIDRIKDVQVGASALSSPFPSGVLFHHLSVEFSSAGTTVPSQSLLDVRFAKSLGFDFIEANIQRCSDGVYVVKHGLGSKLGNGVKLVGGGDCSDIEFANITSVWLRENVVYDSTIAKYCVSIPTIEEFCEECKEQGMGILLAGYSYTDDCLPIVRKYLSDSKIITVGLSSRGDFRGYIDGWWDVDSVAGAISLLERYGTPFILGWSNYASENDTLRTEIITEMHKRGALVGTAYLKPNQIEEAIRMGIDSIGSTHQATNPSWLGNLYNITKLNDPTITFNVGAEYQSLSDTIEMAENATIVLPNLENSEKFLKVSINIRYSGTISIQPGTTDEYTSIQELQSDGMSFVSFSSVVIRNATILRLVANSQVTIYDWNIIVSVVM